MNGCPGGCPSHSSLHITHVSPGSHEECPSACIMWEPPKKTRQVLISQTCLSCLSQGEAHHTQQCQNHAEQRRTTEMSKVLCGHSASSQNSNEWAQACPINNALFEQPGRRIAIETKEVGFGGRAIHYEGIQSHNH